MFKVDKVRPIDGSCSFPVAEPTFYWQVGKIVSPSPENKPENCNSWKKRYWSQQGIENRNLRAESFCREIGLLLFGEVWRCCNQTPVRLGVGMQK